MWVGMARHSAGPARRLAAVLSTVVLLLHASHGQELPGVNLSETFNPNATAEVPPTGTLNASTSTACVLTLDVDSSRSPFNLSGQVTAPLSARIMEEPGAEPIAMQGKVHLALYNHSGPCPSNMSDLLPLLDSGAWGFVKAPGSGQGGELSLIPTAISVQAFTDQGTPIGRANISGLEMFLYSPEPFPGSLVAGVSAVPTNVTLTAGTGSLSSAAVAGNTSVRLQGFTSEAYPDVMASSGTSHVLSGQTVTVLSDELTLVISNLTFIWPINPATIPGNDFITATAEITGTIVATGAVPDAISEEDLASVAYPNITRTLQVSRANVTPAEMPAEAPGTPPPPPRGAVGNTTTIRAGPGETGTSAITTPGQAVPPVTAPSVRATPEGAAGAPYAAPWLLLVAGCLASLSLHALAAL